MANEAMIERIRKLFAKAESTTSEHERDALLSKAYDLLSKHGIEEALARGADDSEAETVTVWEFEPKGSYKLDQIVLVHSVAKALHCDTVRYGTHRLYVYGVKRHLDRVDMLAGFLVAYMVGNLGTLKPPYGIHATTYRKSAMSAFASTVHDRLKASERNAAEESSDHAGVSLVLVDDARKASDELNRRHSVVKATSRRVSSAGYGEGSAHGNRVDLGGSSLSNRRRAISA